MAPWMVMTQGKIVGDVVVTQDEEVLLLLLVVAISMGSEDTE